MIVIDHTFRVRRVEKKRQEMFAKLESVIRSRHTNLGTTYLIKLVGVESQLWVQARHLSQGVVENFESEDGVPKNDKVLVNRGFAEKQKVWLAKQTVTATADSGNAESSPKKQMDPLKMVRKHAKSIVQADAYVQAINNVLRCVPAKRTNAVKKLHHSLQPSKFCLPNLDVQNFWTTH